MGILMNPLNEYRLFEVREMAFIKEIDYFIVLYYASHLVNIKFFEFHRNLFADCTAKTSDI